MITDYNIPTSCYGILQKHANENMIDSITEQLSHMGYAIIESGYTPEEINEISTFFNLTRDAYIQTHGETNLRNMNELHTIRLLLSHGHEIFTQLALHRSVLCILEKMIAGKFILNQQNGIINPPQETYNQGSWHRDLPYQHFIASKPIAINALFCVDDFTKENGATFVLPASHKHEAFPSDYYVQNNAIQIEAKAGSFILLDCMLFHAGGYNKTNKERRAVNHVYTIPYFKQQINIPLNLHPIHLSPEQKEVLGFNYTEQRSIADFLQKRTTKIY